MNSLLPTSLELPGHARSICHRRHGLNRFATGWLAVWGLVLAALGVSVGVGSAAEVPSPSCAPVSVILDTDMGNDVDDAMALAMLHALESRGECRLLAVTLTKNDVEAGPFVSAVNTFYGRGGIPIGVRREGGVTEPGKYLKAAFRQEGGKPCYPHACDPAKAPEARALLRQVLAAQPDQSVVLIQVGFFANCAGLLDTPPDAVSPLSGLDLVKRKVRLLSVMAGAFQTIDHNNHYIEYNVFIEIPPARKLAKEWPTPIVWSGFEIGIALPYPVASIERDFDYLRHHIIKDAYYLYMPPPHERPTWDLTAVLYAVRPDRQYFELSPAGQVTMEADGFTRFEPKQGGRDRYLILNPSQKAGTREALVQLTSQPPGSVNGGGKP